MAAYRPELPELTPAQAGIMEIVWERGEVSASAVWQLLSRKRRVARNRVRTVIERMEAKGWVKHRVEGRTFTRSEKGNA